MLKNKTLSNPFIFWSIIFILLLSVIVINQSFKSQAEQENTKSSIIQEQSFHESKNNDNTIDLNNLTDININLEAENHIEKSTFKSLLTYFNKEDNLLFLLLGGYSMILSLLFTYREKSNKVKLLLVDEKYDKLQIDLARKKSKADIFDDIEDELLKYKKILSPELNINNLDKKIENDTNYILFSSRVVLEKVLLQICQKYSITNGTLSEMIMLLYKKRVLDVQTNSYAHIIKAFGNKVAHPNLSNPINFNTKDALLVLSTLLILLDAFDKKNLLEGNLDVV